MEIPEISADYIILSRTISSRFHHNHFQMHLRQLPSRKNEEISPNPNVPKQTNDKVAFYPPDSAVRTPAGYARRSAAASSIIPRLTVPVR